MSGNALARWSCFGLVVALLACHVEAETGGGGSIERLMTPIVATQNLAANGGLTRAQKTSELRGKVDQANKALLQHLKSGKTKKGGSLRCDLESQNAKKGGKPRPLEGREALRACGKWGGDWLNRPCPPKRGQRFADLMTGRKGIQSCRPQLKCGSPTQDNRNARTVCQGQCWVPRTKTQEPYCKPGCVDGTFGQHNAPRLMGVLKRAFQGYFTLLHAAGTAICKPICWKHKKHSSWQWGKACEHKFQKFTRLTKVCAKHKGIPGCLPPKGSVSLEVGDAQQTKAGFWRRRRRTNRRKSSSSRRRRGISFFKKAFKKASNFVKKVAGKVKKGMKKLKKVMKKGFFKLLGKLIGKLEKKIKERVPRTGMLADVSELLDVTIDISILMLKKFLKAGRIDVEGFKNAFVKAQQEFSTRWMDALIVTEALLARSFIFRNKKATMFLRNFCHTFSPVLDARRTLAFTTSNTDVGRDSSRSTVTVMSSVVALQDAMRFAMTAVRYAQLEKCSQERRRLAKDPLAYSTGKRKFPKICGRVDNMEVVFPQRHQTLQPCISKSGRAEHCGVYPEGLTKRNARDQADKHFLSRFYPKTSETYYITNSKGQRKPLKWLPGSSREVWPPGSADALFKDLRTQGIAAKSVARFHFTLLRKEVHEVDGFKQVPFDCKLGDKRPGCKKASTPLCVARGYYVTNLCTTCCCRANRGGGRPAALNAKGLQLVMQTREGECAQWFTAMDTMLSMLAGFVDRFYNSYIWTAPCYGKRERQAPHLPVGRRDKN